MLRPIALLLAAQSESGLCNLLKQLERLERLEQLIPPRIWIVLFTLLLVLWILKSLFKLFVFLINVGGQAASILSWLDVPSPFQRAQPYTNQLECNRKQLLTIVKKEVNRRLATSLHNLVKLDLYMEDQRQRVGSPKVERVPEDKPSNNEAGFWTTTINRFLRLKDKEKQSSRLKSTQKIIEVFEQPEISGKLLILGEPGSGKTTELLQLAQDLVTRVEQDDRQPVPVILELSSWDGESIDKWVASQLKKLYTVSEEITQQWLAVNQILLLLDGLDELGLLKQRQCIEKLNQFLESTYVSKLVVCCRREEYEAGEIELDGLNGAVYLEALREDQIRQYFEGLNRLSVWNNVSSNAVLLELAEKPLFMSMLVVAYQGNPIRNEQELFDAYIEKQLHEPRNQGTYKRGIELTPQETRHHLVWLAQQLESISETEFLIEGLQPTWLLSFRQKILYGLILGLANVLLFSLFLTLYYGLLVVGWGGSWNTLIILLRIGIILSLIMSGSFAFTITPIARMPWSFRGGLVGGFQLGICSAVLCGVTIGFSHGLNDALFAAGLFGLLFGLFGFLLIGVVRGIRNISITMEEIPNEGIRKSFQTAQRVALIFGLSGGLIFGPILGVGVALRSGLNAGLRSGLIGGLGGWLTAGFLFALLFGLEAAIQHLILRIFLTINGDTPWNYARFLDHAVKHRFIQRTGGRYRFVHDLLRKHFAAMPLTPRE